jgi:hypothetical protein
MSFTVEINIGVGMDKIYDFFKNPRYPLHRRYEAMRAYFYEKLSAQKVAKQFQISLPL